MAGNITLTIIKPSAVERFCIGRILARINDAGFKIITIKSVQLTTHQARYFYDIHEGKPFFNDLIEFMTSGLVVAALLEKENAVEDFRKLIGSTNPLEAAEHTIRKECGLDIQRNAVHGSDSDENAIRESNFFFSMLERIY